MTGDEKKPTVAIAGKDGTVRVVDQAEFDSLVEHRARQLVGASTPTPASPTSGEFDEVVWTADKGTPQRLTRAQFATLPLDKRITAILRKQLKFFLRGAEVSAQAALKNY
jgi:hypothetical protein